MALIPAIAEVVYQGVSAISANQASQRAKGQASKALDDVQKQQTTASANAASAASTAALVQQKRGKAQSGPATTILTSPLGTPPAITQRKTLLGLVVAFFFVGGAAL